MKAASLILPLVALGMLLPVQQASAFGGMWNNPWAMRRRLIDSVFNDPFFMDPFAVFDSPFFDVVVQQQEPETPEAMCQQGESGVGAEASPAAVGAERGDEGAIPIGGASASDDQQGDAAAATATKSDASLSGTANSPAASASSVASGPHPAASLAAHAHALSEDWLGSLLRAPALDIVPREKEFVVTVDVPGVKKEDINVEIVHNDDGSNTLRVSGERKEDTEEGTTEKGNYRKSHRFGKFSRSVRLPANIQLEGLKASHEHGVLKIVVPKTEQKPKSTPVQIL